MDRKVSKAGNDDVEVGVDVGVVELDGGEHRRPGGKVDELGALVEKGGVVLIAFHDHVAAAAHPVIGLKILGDAPHHEPGVQPQGKEEPGDQGRGGGLAVGAGHHHGLPVAHQEAVQGLGQGEAGQVSGQHRLGLGVVPADDVPHHHQVGGRNQVFRAVAVLKRDSQALQQGAHGRVDVLVGAGHAIALLLQDTGQGRHAGAADAEEVDVQLITGEFVVGHFRPLWQGRV